MPMPDLKGLTLEELIRLCEEAQRLLDKAHPLNSSDLKCPQCGQSRHVRMEVYHWADWESDCVSVDIDRDPAWGAECACNCPECEFSGHVLDFLPAGRGAQTSA